MRNENQIKERNKDLAVDKPWIIPKIHKERLYSMNKCNLPSSLIDKCHPTNIKEVAELKYK
jgi:hypothetical protein